MSRHLRALLLFVAAPLGLFAPQLIHRISLAPGDDYIIDTPYRTLSARIWATGHIPVWDPFSFAGAPMLALGQAGVFYPPNILFRFLTPLTANNVLVIATFVVAALGTYLLARHLTGDTGAAIISGLAFAFCGFMFGHLQHVALDASIAYLPWALYGLEQLRVRFTPWRVLAAATPVSLSSLTGHGQMFATLVLGVGVYAAIVAWNDHGRTLVRAAAMLAAGGAIAAVQILPAIAVLPHTLRSSFSYQDAMSYSFPLSHLPLLVFPYLFGNAVRSGPYTALSTTRWDLHDLSAYPGLIVLCFAAIGVAARRVDVRVRALLVLAGVGLLLSVPTATPIGHVVHALPVFGNFRNWGRYIVFDDLVVALLAAYGIAAIRRDPAWTANRILGRTSTVLGLALAVAVIAVIVPAVHDHVVSGGTYTAALLVPLLFAVAGIVAAQVVKSGHRAALPVVGALVLADLLLSFGGFFEWRTMSPSLSLINTEMSRAVPAQWGAVTDAPGGIDRWVYASGDLLRTEEYPHLTNVKELRSVNGDDPLAPRDYAQALDMSRWGIMNQPSVLLHQGNWIIDLLRVSTVVIDPPSTAALPSGDGFSPPQALPGTGLIRYDYAPRLADAFVVGAVQQLPRDSVLTAVRGDAPFDATRTALVEETCGACAAAGTAGPAGAVTSERWDYESVTISVTNDRPGMLVVSQSWAPGWKAKVDGHGAPVLRADGFVQGVPVPAGTHTVELVYDAPGLRLGELLSVTTIVGLLAGGWWFNRRGRRRAAAPSDR